MKFTDYPQWEKNIISRSHLFLNSYLSRQLSDLNDWEGKAWVFNDQRTDSHQSGILFAGDIGTGKHTALASFIKVYCDVEGLGYEFYVINSVDFPFTIDEYKVFELFIEQLILNCRERKQNAVFVVDEFEKCKYADYILDLLAVQTSLCKGEIDFLFFVVSNERIELTSYYSHNICKLLFDRTTYEQRQLYLKVNAKDYIDEDDSQRFIELLGDCTYGELSTVVENISLISLSKQRPVNESEFAYAVDRCVKDRFESMKMQPVLDLFFNRLEGSLAKFSNSVSTEDVRERNNNSVDESIDTKNPSDYQERKRNEFINMPPKELALSMWGEDGLSEILERADYIKSTN